MADIQGSAAFYRWLKKLRDARGKAIILFRRCDRIEDPLRAGLSNLRQDRWGTLILLLNGGDKSTQADDIAEAKRIANDWSNHHG